jgi:two-component system alkaline phosphatase synthesis response regulator PhoP
MTRILIVEDDSDLARTLEKDLQLEGYEVDLQSDCEHASRRARERSFDLILLDVTAPHKDGFDICRELRQVGVRTPVILLTTRSHESDRVLGLEIGADDYMTKPFSHRELIARVKAMLRRAAISTHVSEVIRFGDAEVDFGRGELRRAGVPVDMTAREFKLLAVFIQNRGRLMSRDHLLTAVWGTGTTVGDRVIDTHVTNLRKKIEPDPSRPSFLLCVRGMGYRFDG